MNKRLRNNDLGYATNDSILNMLDQKPFLYRSLQAVHYIESNPPMFIKTSGVTLPHDIFQYIHNYIIDIFKKFFSGCGISYHKDNIFINDEELIMYFFPPLSENDTESNFSILMSVLNDTLRKFLKGTELQVGCICCDDTSLRIECFIGESEYFPSIAYGAEEPSDNIILL